MVDVSERLQKIKQLVDGKKYFSINKARQYGKTTTLSALESYLSKDYIVADLDFQFLTHEDFKNEYTFTAAFAKRFLLALREYEERNALEPIKQCAESKECGLAVLFERLSDFCAMAKKPVVLIIDEVDSATNNQVFLDFLAQLRGYYLHRRAYPTFQSVILAGVYDLKRLRQKIREDEEHKNNSPWNIAADFDVDMSLSVSGIEEMLHEYENDYQTGMNTKEMAQLLYDYTSGYPFLVSRLCKLMDEKVSGMPEFEIREKAWTKAGFLAALKLLLAEKNTLFESLVNKLKQYAELKEMLYSILFTGETVTYNVYNEVIDIASMLGFVKNEDGKLMVANRIFETLLYNLFTSEEETGNAIFSAGAMDKNQFIQNGILNMELVLEKFVEHWGDLYCASDEKFIEDNGRKLFLLYLKPIINGTGNYYIEAQTRDHGRTDIIVDYRGRQYIIEVKIWRGNEYLKRGEEQLEHYLDSYHATKGYLLSFNFNKNKSTGIKELRINDKVVIEAMV